MGKGLDPKRKHVDPAGDTPVKRQPPPPTGESSAFNLILEDMRATSRRVGALEAVHPPTPLPLEEPLEAR